MRRKTIGIIFILDNDIEHTQTRFTLNWSKNHPRIENKKILVNIDECTIEDFCHELTELTMIEIIIKIHPDIINYPWQFSKNLFHTLTNIVLLEF